MKPQSYNTPGQSQSYFFDGTIITSDEQYRQLWEKANTQYVLEDAFNQSDWSQHYTEQVKRDGYCVPIGEIYRVYSGPLAALMTGGSIPVTVTRREASITWETVSETRTSITQRPIISRNRNTIVDTIQGSDFATIYQNGYDKGTEWFNDNYGDTRSVASALNGPNAQSYIADFHTLSFHNPGTAIYKGMMPCPVTFYSIWQIGFNSGINAQIDSLKEKRTTLFDDLEECRHSEAEVSGMETILPSQDGQDEGIAGPGPISQRALALFVWYCQETGELPRFQEGNKKQGWKAITAPYGNSANAFKNHLTPAQHPKLGYDYRTSDLTALHDVVGRLKQSKQCTLALALAERELHQAKLNSPT